MLSALEQFQLNKALYKILILLLLLYSVWEVPGSRLGRGTVVRGSCHPAI